MNRPGCNPGCSSRTVNNPERQGYVSLILHPGLHPGLFTFDPFGVFNMNDQHTASYHFLWPRSVVRVRCNSNPICALNTEKRSKTQSTQQVVFEKLLAPEVYLKCLFLEHVWNSKHVLIPFYSFSFTTDTFAPSLRLSCPVKTTRSVVVRPVLISTLSPCTRPTVTGRKCARESSVTTYILAS
jgi:hypothetical protein